jgi:pimeloyl-ACP methyl ester carboxylesterase
MNARIVRATLAAALFFGCAYMVSGGEPTVVILKDGFVIQGNVHKEVETVVDKPTGIPVQVIKNNGFEMIDEGPKVTIFSTHYKQLGALAPDTKLRPDYKGYRMGTASTGGTNPLPIGGETIKTTDFDAKWVRTLTVKVSGAAPEVVRQQITYIDPYYIYIFSSSHRWRLTYRTSEWDPKLVRKLLLTHPEITEPDGKCDPLKRVLLGKFLLDAGWVQMAKDEMDRLNRDLVGTMNKDAREQYEKLLKEIDQTTGETGAREAELALAAGRYKYAAELLATFPEKTAAPKDVARVAKVSADLKTGQERYDSGRRLLRSVIDEATGTRKVNALVAAGGGLAFAAWQPKGVPVLTQDLAAAAEQVYAEIHPDSAIRIETFVTLAAQAERKRAAGEEPPNKPEELLATAVSGWAKGKNGATPNPETAWRLWSARELVLSYQRAENMNDRTALIGQFRRTPGIPTDELAQMISLLPPAAPEDLTNRTGTQVPLGAVRDTGIYRRKTLPVAGHVQGIEYLVRLPPEYHHGRAYPVLIVLTHPGLSPEDVLRPLITEADKNGYILVVPEWSGMFAKTGYDWKPEYHVYVTAALRDTVRHFTVDNDRVFLTGVADGANMAFDVGIAHPDLFAGVIPMGPIPKLSLFMESWRNAQKLPFYIITGEQIGPGMESLRRIFEKWMPRGYPALWTIYKGRGVEWYSAEAPVMFDWMSRKTRVNGTATLALGTYREPWQMLREMEHRYYWLQANDIVIGKNGGSAVPATMIGDVRGNNLVDVHIKGVKRLTVWLSPDMIDWSKPVKLQINGSTPEGWNKPKDVGQNLEVLLEDYYERGDRRMLFLNKIELDTKNYK